MNDQEGAISGRISDRPVADLFQWLHETRRTGVARFRTALGTATVWFRDGELVDADMGRFHQDAAVLRLMRINDGEYEVEQKPVSQRRMIKQSTALLLAEGRQRAPRPGPARGPSAGVPAARTPSSASVSPRSPSAAAVGGPGGPGKAGSGEYSLVRDDSHTRPRAGEPEAAGSGSSEARRSGRGVDTGAHTILSAKAPPRPPGKPAVESPARLSPAATVEPLGAARVPAAAVAESPAAARGPAARRRGVGWSPTAGGPGQAPEPTPSARSASSVPGRPATDSHRPVTASPEPTAEADEAPPRSGRTRFMFGVAGPGAEREPSSPPVVPARAEPVVPPRVEREPSAAPAMRPRAEPVVPSRPEPIVPSRVEREPSAAPAMRPRVEPIVPSRVEREPSVPPVVRAEPVVPSRPEPVASAPATPAAPRFGVAAPTPPAGAVTTPMPPDDSGRTPSESRRRRPRAVARAQAPFEPERTDRTLLRPGPLPPPPGQPVVIPASGSQAIPLGVPPSPSQAIPVGMPAIPSPGVPNVTPALGSQSIPIPMPAPAARPGYEPPITTTAILGSDAAPARPPVATPFAAPAFIDEEYSHPISVPSVPSLHPGMGTEPVGPGGTWVLNRGPNEKPLPDDPEAEQTMMMRAPDVPAARGPSVSTHVKAASGTAHVGRYEVLLRLARGGMGTVYLCRVTGEGGFRRLFALKVIREHLNTNQAYVQMLLEEARIASRLSHPNIVSIIDIDTFAGQHYLVMDYVEGCTLSELLKAHPKARPPELVVPIVLDALTGLHAAHSMRGDDGSPHPVVHCDFSPQNMLVGVNGTCRLTDFGVSKAADALPNGPGRGKPGYLSPEQVRGLPLDPRSDIFSAGVVLWNALTGEQLFDGDDPQQVLHQVVSKKIPKPSTVGLRPPACFDRICLRALERDPAKRYQTAEQMLTELRKVAIAEDLLAPSSAVGHWVQETFGAQIELRRQAAGLQPNPAVAALALRDLVSGGASAAAPGLGLTGHSEGFAHDGSVTGHDPDASMTMMLRAGVPTPEAEDDREGLGARARVVVIVAALAFIAAGVVTLFVRPDLLQGGVIDERGQYIDLSTPPDREPLTGTEGEPPAAEGDATTGAEPPPVAADATAAERETDTDGDADPGDEATEPAGDEPAGDTEPAAADDGKAKGKGGKGKGKAAGDTKAVPGDTGETKADGDAKADTKAGKGKGKGKGKTDDTTAPPPDLDELFRQPGG